MKTLRKLILLSLLCYGVGYASGAVYAQGVECFATSTQGSCIGDCICYAVETSCTNGYACSAGGGACPESGGVSISWKNERVCNF